MNSKIYRFLVGNRLTGPGVLHKSAYIWWYRVPVKPLRAVLHIVFLVAVGSASADDSALPWKPMLFDGLTTMSVTYYADGQANEGRLFFPPGYCSDTRSPAILLVVGNEESFSRTERNHGELAARIALQDIVVLLVQDTTVDRLWAAVAFVQGESGVDRNRIGIVCRGGACFTAGEVPKGDHRIRTLIGIDADFEWVREASRNGDDWMTISDDLLENRIRAVRNPDLPTPEGRFVSRGEPYPAIRLVSAIDDSAQFDRMIALLHEGIGYTITP